MSTAGGIDISCYDDIIAISRTECECLTNYSGESLSGLYLDESEGLNLPQLFAQANCEKGSAWDLAEKAIDAAKRSFVADTNNLLIAKYKQAVIPFKGIVGDVRFQTTLNGLGNTVTDYCIVPIACKNIVGGTLEITHITALFSATGTKDLYIINNYNEALYHLTIQTEANKPKVNALPTVVSLPMYDARVEYAIYYLVYQTTDGNYPKDNSLKCNCGGFNFDLGLSCSDWFNEYLSFATKTNYQYGWASYLKVGGGVTNGAAPVGGIPSVDFINLEPTFGSHMMGLQLSINVKCDIGMTMCSGSIDFTSDPLAMAKAKAIQHKASFLLLSDLMSGQNINYSSLINGETAGQFMNYHKAEYVKLIGEIVMNTSLNNSDCFTCNKRIKTGSL